MAAHLGSNALLAGKPQKNKKACSKAGFSNGDSRDLRSSPMPTENRFTFSSTELDSLDRFSPIVLGLMEATVSLVEKDLRR